MKILITGGTGFIGSHLCEYFYRKDFDIFVLTRSFAKKRTLNHATFITELNPTEMEFDVIINLAGEPLNQHRWNEKSKKNIHQSRIEVTQKIINYIRDTASKPRLLISGSAIGFYGHHANKVFTEASSVPTPDEFIHQLCNDWEKTATEASTYGTRVCLLRMGVVLGENGGILKAMVPLFRLGLGAILGTGVQWVSWIHIDDVIRGIELLIHNEDLNGPFNFTAPTPVTNKCFSQELARVLHRPLILRLPNFLVELIFGEMGKALMLNGQKVIPKKLIEAGYTFKFPCLSEALRAISRSG